jgi:hypothetical protein
MLCNWRLRWSGLEVKPQASNLCVWIIDCVKPLLVKGFK